MPRPRSRRDARLPSAAAAAATAVAQTSEEILEIDGSIDIGSDISLADDTSASEKADTLGRGDAEPEEDQDAISFDDGELDGLMQDDVEIELSVSDGDGTVGTVGTAASAQIPRAFSQAGEDPPVTFVPATAFCP